MPGRRSAADRPARSWRKDSRLRRRRRSSTSSRTKWDVVDKQTNTMSDFTKIIRQEYKFLDYAPVCYVSALKKQRLDTLFDTLNMVHLAYYTRVKTSLLNEVMQDAQIMNQAPNFNGGRLKILYASQVETAPPTIVLFVNDPNFMHFSYERYLENRLRETFNFEGTPIRRNKLL